MAVGICLAKLDGLLPDSLVDLNVAYSVPKTVVGYMISPCMHVFKVRTMVEHRGVNLRCGWSLGDRGTVYINT